MGTTRACRARGKLLAEVLVLVDASSAAGRERNLSHNRIGTEHLDRLEYRQTEISKVT